MQFLRLQAAAVFMEWLIAVGSGAGSAESVAIPSECKQKTGRDFVDI